MLDKLKNALGMNEDLKTVESKLMELIAKIQYAEIEVKKLCEHSSEIAKARDELMQSHSRMLQQIDLQKSRVFDMMDKFEKELTAFGNVKRELSTQLGKALEQEIKQQIAKSVSELSLKANDISNVKKQLDELNTYTKESKDGLKKLTEAISKIKDNDFKFENALSEVKKAGDEKAKLLLTIEHLEYIISKMKQKTKKQAQF